MFHTAISWFHFAFLATRNHFSRFPLVRANLMRRHMRFSPFANHHTAGVVGVHLPEGIFRIIYGKSKRDATSMKHCQHLLNKLLLHEKLVAS